MKKILIVSCTLTLLISCSKKSNTPAPVIDNGPIGGSYNFSAATTHSYDTIPGSGILTTTEYTSTTTGHKGTLTITSGTITSKGLMFDFSTSGVRKETNTTTGATVTTNIAPFTGTSGGSSTNYSSTYSFSVPGAEITIADAQYIFNPAFLILPSTKKFSYSFSGNLLKISYETYSAANRSRTVHESSFIKQ